MGTLEPRRVPLALADPDRFGRVLGDVGCPLLDFVTGIVGDARLLRCTVRTFPKIREGKAMTRHRGQLDANDTAIIEIDFANGALGTGHAKRWATGHTNNILFEAHGTEGALRIDLDEGGLTLHTCLGELRIVHKERQCEKIIEYIFQHQLSPKVI